jgi:putative membrane protein
MTTAAAFPWLPGEVHLDVVVGVVLLAGAYTWATIASGRPAPLAAPMAFFGGCAALLAALNGPLHDLSDYYLFSAHMVQHLVLTLVVPPLWLAGTPGWMVDALLARVARWRSIHAALHGLTRPLPAFAAFGIAVVAWHLPGPYNAALETHAWHVVEHLVLLVASVLGWWPILSRSERLPALPYAGQLLYLFVFGMPMTVVAAMVTGAEHVLYPYYAAAPRVVDLTPLADQRLGGVIMWVPAGIIPVVAFTVVFFRWAAAEAEDAA